MGTTINRDDRVAECAVVGVHDALRGQAALAFVVLKQADALGAVLAQTLEGDMMQRLGFFAWSVAILFVPALPKTRSGKVLRRAIVAIREGRDPDDVFTLENPLSLKFIKDAYP